MLSEGLTKLVSSASKVVLLLFSAAFVIGLFTGHISEDSFKVGALMVLTYYFTSKGDTNLPYGGK
jgi:hypothetical protein